MVVVGEVWWWLWRYCGYCAGMVVIWWWLLRYGAGIVVVVGGMVVAAGVWR